MVDMPDLISGPPMPNFLGHEAAAQVLGNVGRAADPFLLDVAVCVQEYQIPHSGRILGHPGLDRTELGVRASYSREH